MLTAALLGFMAFWGEYGFASIIIETQTMVFLMLMQKQKQFVRGMTAGALKDAQGGPLTP